MTCSRLRCHSRSSSRGRHVDASVAAAGKARLLLDAEDGGSNDERRFGHWRARRGARRAVLGLPTVMVTLAENQRGIARLMKAEAAVDGGALDDGFVRVFAARVGLLADSGAQASIGSCQRWSTDAARQWSCCRVRQPGRIGKCSSSWQYEHSAGAATDGGAENRGVVRHGRAPNTY